MSWDEIQRQLTEEFEADLEGFVGAAAQSHPDVPPEILREHIRKAMNKALPDWVKLAMLRSPSSRVS